ncbi:PepSY-associated TM helix domain-containing protein [Nitrosomonas supralitoralis]|uniref:Peptidase n=1 Tax=Nitrosomonas supralitoralis TaxID=2116706 RepID=A0A2P7NZA1_9PROT|nr:PepSY-associated TM helix domain-containing protein [Nitrosomonas supralitoralis]PSJ18784.1 peptidase [Nitrosomonas supralitoralis]
MKKFVDSTILTATGQQGKQSGKSRVNRQILTLLHRWTGLFLAVFLFISGLTGAIISWDHELDEWLNPQLFDRQSEGDSLPPTMLADQLEAADPRILVTWLPLTIEPDENLGLGVKGRIDPSTGKAFDLGFNQIALDPASGELRGSRMWGEISLTRENFIPFLYKLHYSMHIPDAFGIELGIVLMGILAIVWCIDCCIALWIAFPNFEVWRKSFAFRWQQGGYKLNFDLHRSGGVWLWGLLLILAVTAVSMNLKLEITRPIVSIFSTLTPDPFAIRTPNPHDEPIEPMIGRSEIIELALAEAQKRNWRIPLGGMFYDPEYGIYGVTFHEPGQDHAEFGLGNPWIYFDGQDGSLLGEKIPGAGSAGDIFLDAQFPLHSGRILGLPGRIMISILGLLVAMLSVTGVIIWQRKRWAHAQK